MPKMLVGALQARAVNMQLIIGSRALAHAGLLQQGRIIKDTDVITTIEDFEQYQHEGRWDSCYPLSDKKWKVTWDGEVTEVEIAWPGSSGAMLLDYLEEIEYDPEYAPPEVCLMLKMSHRFLKNSPHFKKTREDIMWLRQKGVTLDSRLTDILSKRQQETYWYEHPNLNRTKDEFFVDVYQFDHDSLHEAVALMDHPAYTNFQKSDAEVDCDMDKFMEQPIDIQLAAVYEESCVLALERSFIPHGRDQQWAFEKALEKVCTSITSGRFREFAWEHYDDVLELKKKVEPTYTVSFFEGIVNGTVKKWEEE
jgi:hypothetical protein